MSEIESIRRAAADDYLEPLRGQILRGEVPVPDEFVIEERVPRDAVHVLPSKPPCDFCRREVPCECSTTAERAAGDETCMCTCGRCMAPYPWEVAR